MKLKIIIITALFAALILDLKSQSFSIFAGLGIPAGKADYPKNNFSDAALFSNNGTVLSCGLEYTFKSSENYGFGIHAKYNKYFGWKAKNISDRFVNSSLNTFDIGPLIYFNLKRLTLADKVCRIKVIPFISYVKFTNPNTVFNLYSELPDNHYLIYLQKKEDIAQFTQCLSGVYVAFNWFKYINEKTGVFISPGLTFMLTKPDTYPDKYIIVPSVSIGYVIDNSRNKWFFIKNN